MTRSSIFLLMLSFTLMGCDTKQQSSVAVIPAPSSNTAVVRALDAMKRRDRDAMLTLVAGGAKAQDFFRSVIDSMEAIDAFRHRFIAVYGEDAWIEFQAPLPDGQERPDINLTMLDLDQLQRDSSGWEANDENRGVFDAIPKVLLPFKEIEGGWVIDGTRVFSDEETLVGFTKTQRKLTDFIRGYMKAIGHSGIKPEDIDYQMGKEFLIVLMGGEIKVAGKSPNPDRFRLDDL